MIGSLGLPELLFILVLALLIFGPKRLPEVGRTLGKAMAEFRRSTNELKRSIETEIALDEKRAPVPPASVPAPRAAAVPAVVERDSSPPAATGPDPASGDSA